MVRLDNSGENGESVLVVELCIVAVAINTGDLDLLAGLCGVDQVPQKDDFAVSWETSSRDCTRRLLQSKLLVVSVNRLLAVDRERSTRLAILTEAEFDLRMTVLVERSESDATLGAVKLDVLELREDTSPASDNA